MVLGMLWRGTNRVGAVAGMLAGLGITVYYMASNAATVRAALGLLPAPQLWFGIRPLSAGVFGVPLGFAVTWLASVLTRRT
jgi:cation/acetate symporter